MDFAKQKNDSTCSLEMHTMKRFTVTHIDPKSTPLPEDRVREATIFEVTGTDLAGPLFLRDGTKAWIVIFTCAVYRAVHLELITSLTAEAFFQAFRRFIARRGRPEIIYSENGSNFVKAHKTLSKLDWQKIEMQSALKKIMWKFIPPLAPWWGGWWERLIGTMKQILRRVLGQASLNYEELSTVLCDKLTTFDVIIRRCKRSGCSITLDVSPRGQRMWCTRY